MFITVYDYRVRMDQADAAIALYAHWHRGLAQVCGFVSGELLTNIHDSQHSMIVFRFVDEDAAWAAAETPEQRELYARLIGLAEAGPIVTYWQI